MRRTIYFLAFALLPLWLAGDADAQFNGAMRGDYNMTLNRSCFQTGSSGIVVRGIATFNGNGAGTIVGQSLETGTNCCSVPPVSDQICTITYGVNSDGTFTVQANCNLTITSGSVAAVGNDLVGSTATWTGIQLHGQLSLDGTILLLSDTAPNTETFTWTSGNLSGGGPQPRECNSSGVATSRR
jgi:hypothetical protein